MLLYRLDVVPGAHLAGFHVQECTMRAMVLDGDGCTLVLDKKHLLLLHDAGLSHIIDVAPPVWRAFEFNLGHTVADVPG
eukprot:32625-Eustigmatos_ZCMA.PRE.1